MTRRITTQRALCVLLVFGLLAAACGGDDESEPAAPDEAPPAEATESEAPTTEPAEDATPAAEAPDEETPTTEPAEDATPAAEAPDEETPATEPSEDATPMRETMVYVVPALRGEDLGCPDCSLGSALNMNPIFEPLLYRDFDTGQIVPGEGRLAESWSVNNNFTEYSFTLRQGTQFHGDWGEVTTDDVAFSFDLMTRPETVNPGAAVFGAMDLIVDGPYDFRLVSKDRNEDGDPDPSPAVVTFLTEIPLSFMVTSRDYWDTVGEEAARLHPIGSGPYQFTEHEPGVSLTFEKFPEHYRLVPEVDEIVIEVAAEFGTRFNLVQAGDADLMIGGFDQIPAAGDAGLAIKALPMNRNPAIYLPFYQNPQGAALSDPAPWDSTAFGESGKLVRKALSLLVDRDEIVEFILGGYGTTEGACVQSWWAHAPGFDEECVPDSYDPDTALALLNQAGYGDFDDLSVRLSLGIHPAFPACGEIAEAVAQQWRNAGVDVTTEAGDYATVVSAGTSAREANYAFCFAGPARDSGVQRFSFYSRTTDRLSFSGETPEIDELVNNGLASEAVGGEFQETESRKLFDHAYENTLGITVAFAHFVYFSNPCLNWPALPGTVAFNIHNFEFVTYTC